MRILVTRAEADAASTATALAKRGHQAVLAPVTAIEPTGAAWPPGRFDAVMATSRHAFAAALGTELDRVLPVFAVGHGTAAAARAAGFRDVRIGAGDAAALADLLRLTLPRPARLLYLAGRDRKAALEPALGAAGYEVSTVEVYAAEAVTDWPASTRDALREHRIDAVLHYSRRSADLAVALAHRAGLEDAFLLLRHVCLSGDCAELLMERRAASVAIADRPDEEALLAALDATRR